jgi:DNA invertase Pin-like site-specific DNA recombinase
MSFRRGAPSGSRAVGIVGSRALSRRVAIAPRHHREQSTRVAFAATGTVDRGSQQARGPTPTEDEKASGSQPALHPVADARLVGAPDDAEPKRAPRARRAAVLGYASADPEQRERAASELRRQVAEITSECERRGLDLIEVIRESGRQHRQRVPERPGLAYALGRIAARQARGLVVSDLSRVSHSLPELGQVLEWLAHRDARFVAARPGLDTDDEAGRLAVRTIIEVSRWERQRLVERTRRGMRAARRKGPASVADDPELGARIAGMRAAGMTLQAIADQLNADRIPTVRGGTKWRPSSVQAAAGYHRPPASHALDPQLGEANPPNTHAERDSRRNSSQEEPPG